MGGNRRIKFAVGKKNDFDDDFVFSLSTSWHFGTKALSRSSCFVGGLKNPCMAVPLNMAE